MASDVALTVVYVGLTLMLAKLLEDLVGRAGLPGFIGAILAGLILGPAGLGLINRKYVESMGLLLVVGVDFLLFLAGAEELSKMKRGFTAKEVAISIAIILLTSASVALTAHYASPSLPWRTSLAYGVVMGIVSLGPLARALIDAGLVTTPAGLTLTRIGLLAEVTGILAFNTLFSKNVIVSAVTTTLFFLLIYLFGRRLLTRLLYLVEDYVSSREAPFAVIIALVFMASYLAELLGFNAAVTALLLGLFASSYLEERPAYMERLRAFTYGFLEPLFFAGIGLKMPRIDLTSLYITGIVTVSASAPKLLVAAAAGLMPLGVGLLAKGGIDAALLLSLYEERSVHRLPATLYTGGILSMLVMTLAMALGLRGFIRHKPRAPEPWRMRVGELKLGYDVVRATDNLLTVSMILGVSDSNAVVVIDDEGRPIGYITAADLIYVAPSDMKKMKAIDVMRENVVVLRTSDRISELLREHVANEPIIAVVDEQGRIVGTLNPKRVIRLLLYGSVPLGSTRTPRG